MVIEFPAWEACTMQTTVQITTADGTADAYLAKPAGDGPFPAVLMHMDAFGLRPRIAEMAERIAERGYVVLVPNLFYRHARPPVADPAALADPEQRAATFGRLMPMMQALTREVIVADTTAYLDWLAARPEVRPGPVATVGYCVGGMLGLHTIAALPDRIAALGSFHAGHLVNDQPSSPHLAVRSITGEVYLAHADNDQSMTPEQIKALEAELDAAGVTYTSELYEGSTHGFTMSDTAMYHEASEQRHWVNLFALLDRALPAAG
jgi:carboxymethylenebutenolidase